MDDSRPVIGQLMSMLDADWLKKGAPVPAGKVKHAAGTLQVRVVRLYNVMFRLEGLLQEASEKLSYRYLTVLKLHWSEAGYWITPIFMMILFIKILLVQGDHLMNFDNNICVFFGATC